MPYIKNTKADDIILNRHVISCRVNDDELKNIKNVANNLNMKKSQVIKLAINDSLKKYRPINLTNTEKHHMDKNRALALNQLGSLSTKMDVYIHYLKHASDNINQVAHAINSHKYHFQSDDIKHMNILVSKLLSDKYMLDKEVTKIWQLLELPIQ